MTTDHKPSTTRRTVLQAGGGLLAAAALPAIARAEDRPPIGTWPDGSSGSSVFIGICVPRTGTYALQGEDELKGYELAVEHINSGNELIKKIAPKVTKGLLGKTVKLVSADSGAAGVAGAPISGVPSGVSSDPWLSLFRISSIVSLRPGQSVQPI